MALDHAEPVVGQDTPERAVRKNTVGLDPGAEAMGDVPRRRLDRGR
jgi:hypothetical protein